MSYKTDLAYPKQQPSRQTFLEYLKEQHQHSLETTQSLQHKVQILQKSINHMQARIKLKDHQLHQQSSLLSNKQIQLQELRDANNQLLTKNKHLKKQNVKIQNQLRQLQQDMENDRLMINNLQKERVYLLQRAEEKHPDYSAEIDYLKDRNLQLERQISKFKQNSQVEFFKEELKKKVLEIQDLNIVLDKLSSELQNKTEFCERMNSQYQMLLKANQILRIQLNQFQQSTDPLSRRKSTKISYPSRQQQYNTNSSNRNKSIQMGLPRRAGGIRSRNVHDESLSFQSDVHSVSRMKQPAKQNVRVQYKRPEQHNFSKQQQEKKKESLLQNLVARFQKLKSSSLTNTLI